MKRTILALSVVMALGACSAPVDNPLPMPVPTKATTPPVETSKPNTELPTETPQEVKPTNTQKPEAAPSPTQSPAITPAVEFAQRWGKRYPDVPEFAILKAANGTCDLISNAGNDWENNPLVETGIAALITGFGLSDAVALEFAQDANQNYCSSREF